MILFTIFLALADVFVLSQIGFWGISPLFFAVVVYMFRYETSWLDLVLAAAVYGFVSSVITSGLAGLLHMTALVVATAISLGALRLVRGSKLRITMKGYDASFMTILFCGSYWLVFWLSAVGTVAERQLVLFSLWSLLATLLGVVAIDLLHRRVRA